MSDTPTINLENVTTEFKPVEIGFVTIIPEPQSAFAPFTPVEGTPLTVVENKPSFPTFELNPQTINLSSMGIVLANPVVVPENQETVQTMNISRGDEIPKEDFGTFRLQGSSQSKEFETQTSDATTDETVKEEITPATIQPVGE
ncbi:MAG: hypothetical protein EBS53_05800 [Bacteroidetes bacterium]|nr:hypothetical protein [Bacteroidota bacterium]